MAGLHINDHQMRLYMSYRQTLSPEAAAAKVGSSTATAYRPLDQRRVRLDAVERLSLESALRVDQSEDGNLAGGEPGEMAAVEKR